MITIYNNTISNIYIFDDHLMVSGYRSRYRSGIVVCNIRSIESALLTLTPISPGVLYLTHTETQLLLLYAVHMQQCIFSCDVSNLYFSD